LNAAVASAALEFVIAAFFLATYAKWKHEPALYFGLGMLSYAIAHLIAGTWLVWIKAAYNYKYPDFIMDINYKIAETLRNIFVGLFMTLALLAVNSLKNSRVILYFAFGGLIAFLAMRLTTVWVLNDVRHPLFALAQWVFLIPGSLLVAYYSYEMAKETGSKGLLLVALSFVMYAVLLPIYAYFKGTPYVGTWYLMRAASQVVLLVGLLLEVMGK